jgi:prevent-host-death family protein
MATTTVRELRNHFHKVKEIVEAEGEVIVTYKGRPTYKLTLYRPVPGVKAGQSKDYMARLRRHQLRPMRTAAAKSLNDENRSGR